MLSSLGIKNYRNLKYLNINSLKRVNLITGKNNTGKSTLLEAIAMYATKGDISFIHQLLEDRGESIKQRTKDVNSAEDNIKMLSSLFNNRKIGFDIIDAISIGNLNNDFLGENTLSKDSISLRFVNYIEEIFTDEQGNKTTRKRIFRNGLRNPFDDYVGFEIITEYYSNIVTLEVDLSYRFRNKWFTNVANIQFIRTQNIKNDNNGKLFDKIALTEKEKYVIEALKIIEPLTERIAFVEEAPGERSAVVKLSDSKQKFPLQNMGDGMNRILTVILALVNAENGYLLIDEFENGLHHSVQEKLWTIIFELSRKLNIQIFVTTHSNDCIKGFVSVLNDATNSTDGKLIRLDNKNGMIKQVEFDAKELKIATDRDIEIR